MTKKRIAIKREPMQRASVSSSTQELSSLMRRRKVSAAEIDSLTRLMKSIEKVEAEASTWDHDSCLCSTIFKWKIGIKWEFIEINKETRLPFRKFAFMNRFCHLKPTSSATSLQSKRKMSWKQKLIRVVWIDREEKKEKMSPTFPSSKSFLTISSF